MEKKVVMILVDGMRPDSLAACGNPYAMRFLAESTGTLEGKTVMPSVTLPCHMSLFHSVEPARHGTTTNYYMPQVRPINGLFEAIRSAKKTAAMIYNWGELRDLGRPDSFSYLRYFSGHIYGWKESNRLVTEDAIRFITEDVPDFLFVYLGCTDETGHKYGWMTPEYLKAVSESWNSIRRIVDDLPPEYTVVVLADHGGHDRGHGTDMPEDMTIPIMLHGEEISAGGTIPAARIIDLAPTVASIMGITSDEEWEGVCLL